MVGNRRCEKGCRQRGGLGEEIRKGFGGFWGGILFRGWIVGAWALFMGMGVRSRA
jgi:hypothetical protein